MEEDDFIDVERDNLEDQDLICSALLKCVKECDDLDNLMRIARQRSQCYPDDNYDGDLDIHLYRVERVIQLKKLQTLRAVDAARKRIAIRNSYLKERNELLRDKRGSETCGNKKRKFREVKARDRQRKPGLKLLRTYYLSSNPVLPEQSFIHKFRIPRETYRRIRLDILEYEKTLNPKKQFFLQRSDVSGKKGINSHLKLLAAFEILGHNMTYEELEAFYGISPDTIRLACIMLCKRLIKLYASDFIRMPTVNEAKRVLEMNFAKRGLPFYLGSVDCSHILRTKCQYELRGEYTGKEGKPTLQIEAMADENRYIWHMSAGEVGSRNDLNTWYDSTLASEMLKHSYDTLVCKVGNMNLNGFPFLLGDQIYPKQRHLLKLYRNPTEPHEFTFNKLHSGTRKAIEVAFGNLQNYFNVTKVTRQHYRKGIVLYTKAATILYNMNVITRVARMAKENKKLFVWDLPEKYNWLTTQSQTDAEQEDLNQLVGEDEDVENINLPSVLTSESPALQWSDELGQDAIQNMRIIRDQIAHFVHAEKIKRQSTNHEND